MKYNDLEMRSPSLALLEQGSSQSMSSAVCQNCRSEKGTYFESSRLINPQIMIERLNSFYRSNGIHSLDFRCKHKSSCHEAAGETFTGPKASFVGRSYEMGELPRLLFLSLDSGTGSSEPEERTLQAVRIGEEKNPASTRHKGRHWYQTDEFALIMLRRFRNTLRIDDVGTYTARVNSAKCCANLPRNSQAPNALFDNCKEFLEQELTILDPAAVITQGNKAKDSVARLSTARRLHWGEYGHIGSLCCNGHETLWVHTYHPSYRQYWDQKKACRNWETYAGVMKASFRDETLYYPSRIEDTLRKFVRDPQL